MNGTVKVLAELGTFVNGLPNLLYTCNYAPEPFTPFTGIKHEQGRKV